MRLVNFTLEDINNEELATDNDYARIRVGLLRDMMLHRDSTDNKVEELELKFEVVEYDYKLLEEDYEALIQSNNKLYQKILELKEMELLQRKRALKLQQELDAIKSIKIDIRG